MDTLPHNTALIVIDVQVGFDDPKWGQRNNPQAEGNVARLLQAWRENGRPIFHVRHLSLKPGSVFAESAPGSQIKEIAKPLAGEPVVYKHVNSAFIGTDLKEQLEARGVTHLVITGLTTDHCVSTTTRMAGNYGFTVTFVEDATATFERTGPNGKHYTAQEMHEVNLASLHDEFATVVTANDVLGVQLLEA
jgi:nicotinamidase-related amidase